MQDQNSGLTPNNSNQPSTTPPSDSYNIQPNNGVPKINLDEPTPTTSVSPNSSNPSPSPINPPITPLTTPTSTPSIEEHHHKKLPLPVVIAAIVLILAVGGYFAYAKFIAPNNQSSQNSTMVTGTNNGLIPEGLKAYDIGKNADAFMVYKKDKDFEELLNQLPESEQSNKILGSVAYYSSSQQSGIIAIQYDSAASAAQTTKIANEQKPAEGVLPFIPEYTIEQKDAVVLVSFGKGIQAFSGPLLENPEIKNIDPNLLDSQIITYINNDKTPEVSLLLFSVINLFGVSAIPTALDPSTGSSGPSTPSITSPTSTSSTETTTTSTTPQTPSTGSVFPRPSTMLPTVHAQSFINPSDSPSAISLATGGQSSTRMAILTGLNYALSTSKNITMVIRYRNKSLSAEIRSNLMSSVDEFVNSGIYKTSLQYAQQANSTQAVQSFNTQEVQKAYDDITVKLSEAVPQIQTALQSQIKTSLPNTTANLTYDKKNARLSINIPETDMKIIFAQTTLAPMRARDAARISDLRNISIAVEVYNSEKAAYPKDSKCVDELTGFTEYFKGGESPKDTQGAQTFGNITCKNGYYYQRIGKQYVVWAKMENKDLGNFDIAPEKATEADFLNIKPETNSGIYYVVVKEADSEATPTVQPPASANQSSQQNSQATTSKKVKRTK